MLDAVQVVEPAVGRLSNRLGDPGAMDEFIRIESRLSLQIGSLGGKENGFWRVFVNRHAGIQILHALMLQADGAQGYPPAGPVPYSLSRLARDFRVSRPHVARLLRAAEQEGLVVLESGGVLQLTELGREQTAVLLALRLSQALRAAVLLYDGLDRDSLRKTG